MRLLVVMVATAALASSALAQDSTPFDFGRFHFGMTPAEFGRVAPGPSWQTRHFGDDLIVVGSSDPISIGLQDFWPAFGFRNGHLTKIVFETVAQVAAHSDCAARLQPVLGELETTIGVFNGPPEPDEFGPLQSTQSTPNGSEVRNYNYDADGVAISAANYSGAFFASVNAFSFRQASGEIRCDLTIHLRPSGPPPALDMAAPTNTELAAATEIEPDWVKQPDSDAYEMSVPPIATLDGVSGIATLDCLIVAGGRVNCRVIEERPSGKHFGDAALALSRYYQAPRTEGGVPTLGKRVAIYLRFDAGAPGRG